MNIRHVLWKNAAILVLAGFVFACGGKAERPPVLTSEPPPPITQPEPDPDPEPVDVAPPMETEDAGDDLMAFEDPYNIEGRTLEEINADNPLVDIRFDFDSATLRDDARATLNEHAEFLSRYPGVTVLIEGHCDERGTVEYNLALGERRANAVYNYLLSLGISANRLKTISYGKEFPLDPGHNEAAWAANRRAHFEITAK